MPDYDVEAVHDDTIEYYRLTLALHQKDPRAPETAKADEAVLAMVPNHFLEPFEGGAATAPAYVFPHRPVPAYPFPMPIE